MAQPAAPATRTIFLPIGDGTNSSPMNVAYHPAFNQYYASTGGNVSYAAYVYDNAGNLIQTREPINIDVRSWNFNPHSGLLEVVSYSAVSGGAGRGLIAAEVDGAGLLTGGTSELLASIPGLDGGQTMPAYDPSRDRFYSRSTGTGVNVVDRFDGSYIETVNLDFATAGVSDVLDQSLGFAASTDWFVVVNQDADTAVVFDLTGAYVGTFVLDIDVTGSSYRMGFANNQVFVWDAAREGWQGYDIGIAPLPPEPIVPVPLLSASGLMVLVAGILLLVLFVPRKHGRKG